MEDTYVGHDEDEQKKLTNDITLLRLNNGNLYIALFFNFKYINLLLTYGMYKVVSIIQLLPLHPNPFFCHHIHINTIGLLKKLQ